MKFMKDIQRLWDWLGRWGQVLFVALLVNSLLFNFGGPEWLRNVVGFVATISGVVLGAKLILKAIRHSIWRLRNRLIVTYVFIGLVPILLIATLTLLALWAMSGQVAVYLITSEFNRRMESLKGTAGFILREPPGRRVERVKQIGAFLSENFPDLRIVLADPARHTYPEDSTVQLPPESWKDATGLVSINGEIHGWVNVSSDRGRIMIAVPMTRDFLSGLVPQLGSVSVVTFPQEGVKAITTPKKRNPSLLVNGTPVPAPTGQVPAAVSSWDLEVLWASPTQISSFDSPGSQMPALFSVRTRISAVGRVLLSQKADWDSNWALILIYAFGVLFLVIETVALIVGVSLTRSITNTVHDLYEGTERVKEGDFSHRIRLKGKDQLAQLGGSFNSMTERVEQLLQVAKEKERYEAELEIARAIQKQLYPRQVPHSDKLKLTALYKPARMVSGDYYDYQRVATDQLALALGDVAGKGISAALLMATIQSSFRTQIKTCIEQASSAQAAGGEFLCDISTSKITSLLNQHLYANTPPEKFATFVFGVFNEATSVLRYTNAGHLQPILIRRGEAIRLEVDGMVIGAFPFARYGESQIVMESGDLLVFYTDGISEPENEYGEMYGEDRLTELLVKNATKSDEEILEMIIDAVERWTGSPELQDDMTLLVARCL